MTGRDYKPGEITARGKAIYRDRIQSQVEPKEKGKFVVIDVETGDYEIDPGRRGSHATAAGAEAGRGHVRSARRLSRRIQSRRGVPGCLQRND